MTTIISSLGNEATNTQIKGQCLIHVLRTEYTVAERELGIIPNRLVTLLLHSTPR